MRPRIHPLWIGLGLLAVLLGVGGNYGFRWWQSQPDQLYASAQKSFAQGEEARQQEDRDAARKHYEDTERALQTLLDEKMAPNNDAWLLRHRVLLWLAFLTAREEQEQNEAAGSRGSGELVRNAYRSVRVAAADPVCAEAQALLLEKCFREDQLDLAEPFARNLVQNPPAERGEGTDFYARQIGARFVLARFALHSQPPRPDEALAHLRASEQVQREAEASKPAGVDSTKPIPPRWRAVALEAQALKCQASAARGKDAPADRLRQYVADGLARIRYELAEVADSAVPAPSALAGLSISDARGVLDFLALTIGLAADRRQTLERAELVLSVWEAMIQGPKPSAKVVHEVRERLIQLPSLLDSLPQAGRPSGADWNSLYARLERLLERAREAGSPLDLSACLGLVRNAQKRGCLDAAERLAQTGLKAAEDRHLTGENPQALELHAAAAWALVLQGKPRQAKEHLATLQKQPRRFAGLAHLITGLTAVQDGRLEEGVRALEQAQQHPEFGRTVYPYLGLAYAHAGLAQYDRAVGYLEGIDQHFRKFSALPPEEQAMAARLFPGAGAVYLELFRCHLWLGHEERAAHYRKLLLEIAPEDPRIDAFEAEVRQLTMPE